MNIFMKNLKFKSICIISVLSFFVFFGSINAEVPVVSQLIPDQEAYNGDPFEMSFLKYDIFSDPDGDNLSVNVKQFDGSDLPSWLSASAKPLSLSLVGTYNTPGQAFGVRVVGNYAYVADYTAGLQIINISDPANPSLVGTYNTSGEAYGVAVVGNLAYVADYTAGLQIINISDPANPSLVGTYNTTGYALEVEVVGNYAYVAGYASGLQIINISDPANPSFVGAYTASFASGVAVVGNYAYLSGEGLEIIDISTPASPTLKGSCNTPGTARRVKVRDNYAYLAATTGLQIVDISDPEAPILVGRRDTAFYSLGLTLVGNYVYLASPGLVIIDISIPTSPNAITAFATSADAYDVAVVGDYAYVASNTAGLEIVGGAGGGILLSGTPGFFDLGILDLKATASDGDNSVSTPFPINVLESITNNKPTIIDKEYKKSQNASLRFNKEQFIAAFQDDDNDELSKIQIMSLPDYGKLKLSGIDVSLNQEIDVGDIDNLSYVPEKDWKGTTTFEWRGFDGITYSDEGIVTIKVSAAAIDKDWLEAWWPVITGTAVAVIGIPVAVISAVLVQKAKQKCKKKLDPDDFNIEIKLEEKK